MQRSLVLVVLVAVLVAGCTAGSPSSPGAAPTNSDATTPTVTPTPASVSPTTTGHPSPSRTAPPSETGVRESRTIAYVIRSGSVPEGFSSVTVTFQAIFVDRPADLGPCYPEVFSGPYKPTLTPIGTPAGECYRSTPVTVDLANVTGAVSLGEFTVPKTAGGHALIVTDLAVQRENGTTVEAIKNIGGAELIRSPNRPEGSYGVALAIESVADDRGYDYWLVWDRFDPEQ